MHYLKKAVTLIYPGFNHKKKDRIPQLPDHISQLPDCILHQILSLLPPKDAARTSTLSRMWRRVWYTHPYILFDSSYTDYLEKQCCPDTEPKISCFFVKLNKDRTNPRHKKEHMSNFLDLVDSYLRGSIQHKPNVDAFKVTISSVDLQLLVPVLNQHLCTALQRGVRELELQFLNPDTFDFYFKILDFIAPSNLYAVPDEVFATESLTVLALDRCILNERTCHGTKLPQLRKLSLNHVTFTGRETFDKLVNACTSVEDLYLCNCIGLPTLKLGQILPQLKQLKMENHNGKGVETNKIFCNVNVRIEATCVSLKVLVLHNFWTWVEDWVDLDSKLPCLEVLELHECDGLRRLEISSQSLRRLSIRSCAKLAEINAPNLESLDYAGWNVPFRSIYVRHPFRINIKYYLRGSHNIRWFEDHLINLLGLCKQLKLIVINEQGITIFERPGDIDIGKLLHYVNVSDSTILLSSLSNEDLLNLMFDLQPHFLCVVCGKELIEVVYKMAQKTMERAEPDFPQVDEYSPGGVYRYYERFVQTEPKSNAAKVNRFYLLKKGLRDICYTSTITFWVDGNIPLYWSRIP